jgi:uncharacterized repeat protein (TIGR03803 family)
VFSLTPPSTPGGSWTEAIIHSFRGTHRRDGAYPFAPLLIGEEGSIYGVAAGGGNPPGDGSVFELKPPLSPTSPWDLVTLYTFKGGSDGDGPFGGLVRGKGGVLYGVTVYGGGNFGGDCSYGCGTVFALAPPTAPGEPWTESVLYRFTGINGDGANPTGSLVIGADGALYGTCEGDGAGHGTVYELAPPASSGGAWTETILHAFNGTDGTYPEYGVFFGSNGSLYGATPAFSNDNGHVFRLTPPTSPGGAWSEATLFAFGKREGDLYAGIVMGTKGELYGTTAGGGVNKGGTIFKLTPPATAGDTWHRKLLYSFPRVKHSDEEPGTLFLGINGELYGVRPDGGIGPCHPYRGHAVVGCGTAFELTP